MSLPKILQDSLALPVIGAPLFIISNPDLVLAQCRSGIVGSFPALNARPKELLDEWLLRITSELAADRARDPAKKIAPFAVNQIVHHSNDRLAYDMDLCVKYQVPIIITSLREPTEVVAAAHSYGGLVFHDVISVRHAQKAIDVGVDGLILVCAGAGGHAGTLSPFALVSEIRRFWSGPIALSGAISRGEQILAAQAMGADLAYMGTRFIPTTEANALQTYKQMIVDSNAVDILYSSYFTGVSGNYLRGSVTKMGLDPDALPERDKTTMAFGSKMDTAKAWKEIWGCGQGIGTIDAIEPVATVVARLQEEYQAARALLSV